MEATKTFLDLRADVLKYGYGLHWVEVTASDVTRVEDRNGIQQYKSFRYTITAEVYGEDHLGLKRHRVVYAKGEMVEQTWNKLIAEVRSIKLGRGA